MKRSKKQHTLSDDKANDQPTTVTGAAAAAPSPAPSASTEVSTTGVTLAIATIVFAVQVIDGPVLLVPFDKHSTFPTAPYAPMDDNQGSALRLPADGCAGLWSEISTYFSSRPVGFSLAHRVMSELAMHWVAYHITGAAFSFIDNTKTNAVTSCLVNSVADGSTLVQTVNPIEEYWFDK